MRTIVSAWDREARLRALCEVCGPFDKEISKCFRQSSALRTTRLAVAGRDSLLSWRFQPWRSRPALRRGAARMKGDPAAARALAERAPEPGEPSAVAALAVRRARAARWAAAGRPRLAAPRGPGERALGARPAQEVPSARGERKVRAGRPARAVRLRQAGAVGPAVNRDPAEPAGKPAPAERRVRAGRRARGERRAQADRLAATRSSPAMPPRQSPRAGCPEPSSSTFRRAAS